MTKERGLTLAEQKRKEKFEKQKETLQKEGYREKDLTISVAKTNGMALILCLPFLILFIAIFYLVNGEIGILQQMWNEEGYFGKWRLWLIGLFVLIVVHEVIHGITWSVFAKNHCKSIAFGFIAKYLTPYCCCMEPLKKGQYIIGCLMPAIVLGVIPILISCFSGSVWWFVMGCIMFVSGGGDMEITRQLLMYRSDKKEKICMDHPYECGVVVFER